MSEQAPTDLEKADHYAGLFDRIVLPLLELYMRLKQRAAPEDVTRRAQRRYEHAHGEYNATVERDALDTRKPTSREEAS